MMVQRRQSAFTLTELLVALGLMLVLMAIVHVIFGQAQQVFSGGQALSASMRELMAVQTIIKRDLDGAALQDGPFFIIRANVQVAFTTAAERKDDADYAATGTPADVAAILTADPGGSGAESQQPVTAYGRRTFRQDTLAFFSRGLFPRQTGNDGILAAPMTSIEAFVWYGHLLLPDGSGGLAAPGVISGGGFATPQSNPHNFDASQWILGRVAITLRQPQPPDPADGTGSFSDEVIYCDVPWPSAAHDPRWTTDIRQVYYGFAAPGTLAPLAANSRATRDGHTPLPEVIQNARYDLAGTTIRDYRAIVAAYGGDWTSGFRYRFAADPFPPRPVDAAAAARTVPIFVPHCSQFIVEYAGDFISQDPQTAQLLADVGNQPDGVVDFVIDPDTGHRMTRWYGLPRDARDTGIIPGISAPNRYGSDLLNVVPLRDVLASRGFPAAAFERQVPARKSNYAAANYGDGLELGEVYECAWGPDTAHEPMPHMLRILIKPENSAGSIDVPWREMIFALP